MFFLQIKIFFLNYLYKNLLFLYEWFSLVCNSTKFFSLLVKIGKLLYICYLEYFWNKIGINKYDLCSIKMFFFNFIFSFTVFFIIFETYAKKYRHKFYNFIMYQIRYISSVLHCTINLFSLSSLFSNTTTNTNTNTHNN